MEISNLKLVNFRNYNKLNISLNSNMNIFIGNNASGKTNILESIVLLAITKSHRFGNEDNLIKFGKEKAKITCKVKDNKLIKELSIEIDKNKKSFFVNKTRINRLSNYISNLNIISFTPDDLSIIKSSPNIRRNTLNIQLSQLSKKYLNTLNTYNRILKNRNEYLKMLFTNSISDKSYFDILTDKLIENAIIIYKIRNEYIDKINENINSIYKELTGDYKKLSINYINNANIKDFSDEGIRASLSKIFKSNYYRELNTGMTLYGPHRDDFEFLIDSNNLKIFGSEGQQRIAIISFKLSEIDIFNEILGTRPVLLFDDVFSELDIKKRNRLLKFINHDIQSIVTTTDLKNINKRYIKDSYVFDVENGIVTRK